MWKNILIDVDSLCQVVLTGSTSVATQQQRSELLRTAAASWVGVHRAALRVSRSASGVPVMEGGPADLRASLSRHDGQLLIGSARKPIGVDLEPLGGPREPAWNVLAPAERRALSAMRDPHDRHESFLRLWTVKEAMLKALGVGLSREPASVAVTLGIGGAATVELDGVAQALALTRSARFDGPSGPLVWAVVVL